MEWLLVVGGKGALAAVIMLIWCAWVWWFHLLQVSYLYFFCFNSLTTKGTAQVFLLFLDLAFRDGEVCCSHYWMDCNEILYRRSWSLEDWAHWLRWSADFSSSSTMMEWRVEAFRHPPEHRWPLSFSYSAIISWNLHADVSVWLKAPLCQSEAEHGCSLSSLVFFYNSLASLFLSWRVCLSTKGVTHVL